MRLLPICRCCLLMACLFVSGLQAEPFSTARRIDFFREVTSRNLTGLAARSDGRLINAATVSRLPGTLDADLLWSITADDKQLYLGTGPDGKLLTLDAQSPDAGTVVETELPDSHILALAAVPSGGVLAGTSPKALLALVRDGEIVAQSRLPAGSILDIVVYQNRETGKTEALVATGSPGRIYQVDLEQFAGAGSNDTENDAAKSLSDHGITSWASVRDDNVRTLLRLADGRVIAGSAPKGNIYQFAPTGGAPRVLAENRNAEVTDLLAWDGGFFAAITQSNEMREARVKRPKEANTPPAAGNDQNSDQANADVPPPAQPAPTTVEKFRGRAQLVWFPDNGFPETVANRNNTAFYQLQRYQDWVLITGGEEGELLGYDPARRLNLSFAGAVAAQVNAIQPLPGKEAVFLLVGNNPTGLELLDFATRDPRTVRTDTIDLGVPSEFGALRFDQTAAIEDFDLRVDIRTSYSSDELDGWTEWMPATERDGGWTVAELRGRYFQIRLTSKSPVFAVTAGTLYTLPQNQRPRLQNFRVLAPNFALIPAPDRPERASTTLGQVLQGGTGPGSRDNLMSSEVVPQPGTQVVLWDVDDPDNDSLVSTFSIQGPGETNWTDLVVETPLRYAQFEISHLPEGIYRTRLNVSETSPRIPAQRLSVSFDTDDFAIDRTAPEILDATVVRHGDNVIASIRAKDALSLLRGAEFNLNSGSSHAVENPADGILDGREETFTIEFTPAELGSATSVEIVVLDQNGNSAARRLVLPPR